MNEDLIKIERRWGKRRLFSASPRRRRWPWVLGLLVLCVLVVLFALPLYPEAGYQLL